MIGQILFNKRKYKGKLINRQKGPKKTNIRVKEEDKNSDSEKSGNKNYKNEII